MPKSSAFRIRLAVLCTMAMLVAGQAQTLTTLVDTGAPTNRVDMVIFGDGYTQADMNAGIFDNHIQSLLDYHFTPTSSYLADPFPRYQNFFNVHRLSTPSLESGADIPSQDIFVDTALNASYDTNGIERLLYIDTGLANTARNTALSGTNITADIQYVTVNSSKYGGGGGAYAVYAGANSSARDVAMHELAHSFGGLADEYGGEGTYTGGEPGSPNVTIDPTGAKWSHWLGFEDPRAGSNLDIGVVEGGRYFDQGVYRPSVSGKMRNLNSPFNAVNREEIILTIYDHVNPLDDWRQSSPAAGEPLWVDTIDPNVIKVDWYVDNNLTAVNGGESFSFDNLAAGTHEIKAIAYDEVIKHAFGAGDPYKDLVRKDLGKLQQEVSWTVFVPQPTVLFNDGDYNGNNIVDAADFTVYRDTMGDAVAPFTGADGNGNGIVDPADYLYWKTRFGLQRQTATRMDATINNGSFEDTGGASLPNVANSDETSIPGWSVDTQLIGGWHNAIASGASDGNVYALAANEAMATFESDALTEHLTAEGDVFTLSVDLGSNNGSANEYELQLLFGSTTRVIADFSEHQNATTDGLVTHSFDYQAASDDAGFSPVVRIQISNAGNFSQAFLDNVRLDVAFWSGGSSQLIAVPEPNTGWALAAFGLFAVCTPQKLAINDSLAKFTKLNPTSSLVRLCLEPFTDKDNKKHVSGRVDSNSIEHPSRVGGSGDQPTAWHLGGLDPREEAILRQSLPRNARKLAVSASTRRNRISTTHYVWSARVDRPAS